MARPERNTVDYFPHEVDHGKKMFYLRSKFKNDGYAVWFMLLEELGKAEFHYLDLSDEVQLMYLSSQFMVSEETLTNIINVLVQFGEFDKELWTENSILFNQKFTDNISDAYKKRNNLCVDKKSLILLLESKGIRKQSKSIRKPDLIIGEVPDNPHIKEEYIKEEEIKEKKTKEIYVREEIFEKEILKFFGFTEHTHHKNLVTISAACAVFFSRGELENFKKQFFEYKIFKEEFGYVHTFKNFLGTQDKKFENGIWDSENWDLKFTQEKEKNSKNNNSPPVSKLSIAQKDHEITLARYSKTP